MIFGARIIAGDLNQKIIDAKFLDEVANIFLYSLLVLGVLLVDGGIILDDDFVTDDFIDDGIIVVGFILDDGFVMDDGRDAQIGRLYAYRLRFKKFIILPFCRIINDII